MLRGGVVSACAIACLLMCLGPWHSAVEARPHRKRHASSVSATYVRMRNRWHVRAPKTQIQAFMRASPWPALVLVPVGSAPRQTLMPQTDHGGFDQDALERATLALAEKSTGVTHSIEPRLLDLVYDAVRHFNAPFVHVVSGYRQERGGSRHGQGRAIDFVLPGVSDRQLASYLRQQGFVGVGIYYRAGFVHLDVRASSYFWSDNSAPGARSRPHRMLTAAANRYDARARRRGVTPTLDAPNATEAEAQTNDGVVNDVSEDDATIE